MVQNSHQGRNFSRRQSLCVQQHSFLSFDDVGFRMWNKFYLHFSYPFFAYAEDNLSVGGRPTSPFEKFGHGILL